MVDEKTISLFDNDSDTELYKHKITLEKIRNELINFGLTANQSKVFIYLGKYGAKTASEISKALQTPRTETYHLVNSLQNMGLVTAEMSHPTKYTALGMKQAIETLVKQEQARINLLAGREESLSEMWNEIPFFAVETDESKAEKMQLLHGVSPITNKIKEMIESCTNEFKIFGSIADINRLYHSEVFDQIEESKSELKLIVSPDRQYKRDRWYGMQKPKGLSAYPVNFIMTDDVVNVVIVPTVIEFWPPFVKQGAVVKTFDHHCCYKKEK